MWHPYESIILPNGFRENEQSPDRYFPSHAQFQSARINAKLDRRTTHVKSEPFADAFPLTFCAMKGTTHAMQAGVEPNTQVATTSEVMS